LTTEEDHGDLVGAVLLGHVPDHLDAPTLVDVDADVGMETRSRLRNRSKIRPWGSGRGR
jgi:hypothetical protein